MLQENKERLRDAMQILQAVEVKSRPDEPAHLEQLHHHQHHDRH
jgi:hypothetical protein